MDIISQSVDPSLADYQIIETVLSGSGESFELLMRRYNSRLYRICRSILKDHDEVLDVIQETYFRAFKNLNRFEHRSSFSTWLIKIAIHEALARARQNKFIETNEHEMFDNRGTIVMSQEESLIQNENKLLLEKAIDDLPVAYRTVLVMREIEELSTKETAASLGLTQEVVRIRLHRARKLLKSKLYKKSAEYKKSVYHLDLRYCNRIVAAVSGMITGSTN